MEGAAAVLLALPVEGTGRPFPLRGRLAGCVCVCVWPYGLIGDRVGARAYPNDGSRLTLLSGSYKWPSGLASGLGMVPRPRPVQLYA